MVAGPLRIRVQGDGMISDIDLRLGAGIYLIGLFLAVGVDAFVRDHADLLVIGDGQVYGP